MSARASSPITTRTVRVAVRPDPADCPNPYLRLFYAALKPSGVEVTEALKVNDAWLRERATRLDAIHLHWPETIWRPSPGARGAPKRVAGFLRFLHLAGRLGIKRVWTVHNVVPHEARAGVDFLGCLALARSADLLICHSDAAAMAVRRRYRPQGELVVMQHGNFVGVYPSARDRVSVLKELGLDPTRPVVASLGELRSYKGLDVARAAFDRLGGAVQWVVAGQPHEDTQLLLGGLAPSQAVVLARRLSEQEFSDIASAADLMWLPYHRFTGSSVVLAALTFGTAVVASDLPFFRDVLEHNGPAGHLVPVGDARALAGATLALLKTPRDMRRAAALAVAGQFDWQRTVAPVAAVFTRWLEESR